MSTQQTETIKPARPWEIKDKIGARHGRLTVVSFQGTWRTPSGRTGAAWLCNCDCGNTLSVQTGNLRKDGDIRGTRSCGCSNEASWDKFVLRVWKSYKRECEDPIRLKLRRYRKGRLFNLTVDDVDAIVRQNCFYCGDGPSNKSKSRKSFFLWNGIDRKDNSQGYILANVVPCCRQCNISKGTLSAEAFLAWALRVVQFQSSGSPS